MLRGTAGIHGHYSLVVQTVRVIIQIELAVKVSLVDVLFCLLEEKLAIENDQLFSCDK